MKTRAIIFLLEWILANSLVVTVLNDTYSFYPVPWVLWNCTFGIFLFKLFTAPDDDDDDGSAVWPIGPTVGAFGFVLTAIKIQDEDDVIGSTADTTTTTVVVSSWNKNANTVLGCCLCVLGFALVGISSEALGEEWRDAPPPDDSTTGRRRRTRTSRDKRINLVRHGPYSIIRHPIYCGLLLEALGSNVSGGFASWMALVALISVTTAYIMQLRQEEHELNKLSNGKYDNDYKQRTKYKLVPFVF